MERSRPAYMVSQIDPLIRDDSPKRDILANPRRRTVLQILREAEGHLSLAQLAEELVRREGEGSASLAGTDDFQRCHIMLYHSHVPKLANAGLVTFNSDQRTVALSD